jgi:hypothetical protein
VRAERLIDGDVAQVELEIGFQYQCLHECPPGKLSSMQFSARTLPNS